MKISTRHVLVISMENLKDGFVDLRDQIYLEEVLGLKKDGDSIRLIRKSCYDKIYLISERADGEAEQELDSIEKEIV